MQTISFSCHFSHFDTHRHYTPLPVLGVLKALATTTSVKP